MHRAELDRRDEALPPVEVRALGDDGRSLTELEIHVVLPHDHRRDEVQEEEEDHLSLRVRVRERGREDAGLAAGILREVKLLANVRSLRARVGDRAGARVPIDVVPLDDDVDAGVRVTSHGGDQGRRRPSRNVCVCVCVCVNPRHAPHTCVCVISSLRARAARPFAHKKNPT